MKIGILGGAFDPIHNGHVSLVKHVLDKGLVDKVILMPCFDHKFGKDMLPPMIRLAMLSLAQDELMEQGYQVFPSMFEIDGEHNGSTYESLCKLSEYYSPLQDEIYYIIGSDNASNIDKWHKWYLLVSQFKFIVVHRPGQPTPKINDWYLNKPHEFTEADSIVELSSTQVRTLIKSFMIGELNLNDYVPSSVAKYIKTNNLYK